jgi:hypothetical protein
MTKYKQNATVSQRGSMTSLVCSCLFIGSIWILGIILVPRAAEPHTDPTYPKSIAYDTRFKINNQIVNMSCRIQGVLLSYDIPLKSGITGAKSILQSSVAISQAKCRNSRSL